jgi:hypothetical protein
MHEHRWPSYVAEEQAIRRIRMLSAAGLKLDTIKQLLPCILNDRPGLPAVCGSSRDFA